MTADETLDALQNDTLSAEGFDHAAHIRVAHAALRRYEFFEAAQVLAGGLRRLTVRAGAPQKYNATVTFAFLSLVAERMGNESSDAFLTMHPDLFDAPLAAAGYDAARLSGERARRAALLPRV